MFFGALFFILVGVGIMRWGWSPVQQALDSQNWGTTYGEITSSELIQENTVSTDTTYEPRVSYTFQVNGKNYSGNAIRHASAASLYNMAKDTIAPYPVGKRVRIFYDPTNPNLCVLEKGFNFDTIGLFVIGASIGGFGVIALFASFFVTL